MSSVLPSKEQALFKRVVKCYEQKQYKNGLKFAKQILSNPKFSDHGETLAMKGLILHCLGKKEEAIEHVHRGLKNDVKSYVCWHVYGMLQLFDKKYEEAIKCYRNALRIDQDQVQILKDLLKIQIHVKDFEGFKETRYKLLTLRPTQQNSWIGLALAEHLLNNYDMALDVLQEYVKTQNVTSVNYEHSELLIYQNYVMQDAGKLEEALEHLERNANMICDKLFILENKASLLVKLGKMDEAVTIYWELLSRNTDNISYYQGLENALEPMSLEERMHIYEKANQLNPSALLPQKIPLEFTYGAQFTELIKVFLEKNLRKGVPSLFRAIKNLYKDLAKVDIIQQTILSFYNNLEDYNKLDKESNTQDPESPSTTLWTLILLARHWDHLGQHGKAMAFIDKAIDHTPTFIDSYVTKAKIYKHGGDMVKAAELLDESQSLDTADRFINCKCTKYMLRANMMHQADDMCSRFTKENTVPSEDLNDMQCMWYLTESAMAYQRLENYGEALKKCHQIAKHFADMLEDQFDFHTYCPRKMTLCSYVKMLKIEDRTVYSNKFYAKTVLCATQVYLKLHDDPSLAHKSNNSLRDKDNSTLASDLLQNGTGQLNASELKKLKNKQRKAEKKQGIGNHQTAAGDNTNAPSSQTLVKSTSQFDNPPKTATALDALELATTSTPLEQALTFLLPYLKYNHDDLEMQYLAFEIYYRKRKLIPMLRALKKMHDLDPGSPLYHECSVKFLSSNQRHLTNPDYGNAALNDLIARRLGALAIDLACDVEALNERFVADNRTSLGHITSGAKMTVFLDSQAKERALDRLVGLFENIGPGSNTTLRECEDVLRLVNELMATGGTSRAPYLDRCIAQTRLLFPLCDTELLLNPSVGGDKLKKLVEPANENDSPKLTNDPKNATPNEILVNGDAHHLSENE